jgi:hypothetical protein
MTHLGALLTTISLTYIVVGGGLALYDWIKKNDGDTPV